MSFYDKVQKGLNKANEMSAKFMDDLDNERDHVINMSDERLKNIAMHGATMAQKLAAQEELRNRGLL